MGLIELLLVLVIIGFLTWIVMQIPMPQVFRNIAVGVIVLFVVIWLLQRLQLIGNIHIN